MAVKRTQEKVQSYLMEILGRVELDKQGRFTFPCRSTRVFVDVRPWMERSTVVALYAYTNIDVPVSNDLYRFVASNSNRWLLGRLGLRERDGKALVVFDHNLMGDHLELEDLRSAALCIAFTADEIDDEIKRQFGGRVFHEAADAPPTPQISDRSPGHADVGEVHSSVGYL